MFQIQGNDRTSKARQCEKYQVINPYRCLGDRYPDLVFGFSKSMITLKLERERERENLVSGLKFGSVRESMRGRQREQYAEKEELYSCMNLARQWISESSVLLFGQERQARDRSRHKAKCISATSFFVQLIVVPELSIRVIDCNEEEGWWFCSALQSPPDNNSFIHSRPS